jgi:hypothetical protein
LRITAITGLSSAPARQARQDFCLDSWRQHGFAVEIVAGDGPPSVFEKRSALISEMLARSRAVAGPTMLINADIEVQVPVDTLMQLLEQYGDGIFWFRRHNHDAGDSGGEPELWGIDIFLSRRWPELGDSGFLALGRPWWDYWLPMAAIAHGIPLYTVAGSELWFRHENHAVRWSIYDWLLAGIEVVRLRPDLMRPEFISWHELMYLARIFAAKDLPAHTKVVAV